MSSNLSRPAAACLDRFTQIPNSLHDLVDTPREFQLVALLLSYRWYSDSPIIPSVARLAVQLNCSERTVRRTAASLEARGLLMRAERRADDRRQMSNEYVLCGPLLTAVAAIPNTSDRVSRPSWQGRRTPTSGKPNTRNNTHGTTGKRRSASPIPQHASAYLETSSGRLRPR